LANEAAKEKVQKKADAVTDARLMIRKTLELLRLWRLQRLYVFIDVADVLLDLRRHAGLW